MASREAGGRLSLAVMGGAGVGKTSLVMGLCGLPFTQSYDPTVEDEVRHQLEVDGVLYTLDILDTGGDEEFCKQPWIQQHARDYDGVVLVYAINNYRSFELLEDLFLRPVREASPKAGRASLLSTYRAWSFPCVWCPSMCLVSALGPGEM